jgi:hypothetical protein
MFEDHPLTGAGTDNFANEYVRLRNSYEEPAYPHSLEMRLLSQTGIVGTLLFATAVGAALFGAFASRRRLGVAGLAVSGALITTFLYWLVHGSVDWFWEFPALSVPALVALGLASRMSDEALRPELRAAWLRYASAALCLAAVAAMVLPWIAAYRTSAATASWRANPARALELLRSARDLDPLSAQPSLIAGAIQSRLGNWRGMQQEFATVSQRDPDNWYGHLELSIADAKLGRAAAARREIARARFLNPREPVVGVVAKAIGDPRTLDPDSIDALFFQRAAAVVR